MFVCTVTVPSLPETLVLSQGDKQICLMAALAYMGQHSYGRWVALVNEPTRHIWNNSLYGDEITVTEH